MSWGPLCAFGSSITWAIGSSGYSKLTRNHSAVSVNFTRALIALPLFILATFVLAGGWHGGLASFSEIHLSHLGWFTLSMIGSYGLGDILFLWAALEIGIPAALALASTFPLWTAIAGSVLEGQRLGLLQGVGLVIAVFGVALVILSRTSGTGSSARKTSVGKGVLLAIAASFLWALNGYAVARGGRDLPVVVGSALRMVLALAMTGTMGVFFSNGEGLPLPFKETLRSSWFFVLEAFVGSALYFYGMVHSPLAIASTLSSLAPVLSVPVALILGLEKFSGVRTAGVCAVVSGLALLMGTFPA